jgi:hypothetical protein
MPVNGIAHSKLEACAGVTPVEKVSTVSKFEAGIVSIWYSLKVQRDNFSFVTSDK